LERNRDLAKHERNENIMKSGRIEKSLQAVCFALAFARGPTGLLIIPKELKYHQTL
jgi:hypothetical protein